VESCPDEESTKAFALLTATQREPCAVQISKPWPEPLCAAANARASVGAIAVNTATHKASHTDQRRYGNDSITEPRMRATGRD